MTKHAISDDFDPWSDRVYSPRATSRHLGLSLATIWRLRRRGELPEPIRLSPGRVGWRGRDIGQWLATRVKADRGD